MRLASLSLLALSIAAVAAGCSSNTTDEGAAGSTNTPGAYTPTGNGKQMTEADACKAIVDGMTDAAGKLGEPCTLAVPECPKYIRQSVPGNEACLMYDEGTVKGCVQFYASFQSCQDFANRPCIIGYFKGSAPAGCPEAPDAGGDAVTDDAPVEETSTEDVQTDDVIPGEDGAVQDDAEVQDDGAVQDDAPVQDDAAEQDSAQGEDAEVVDAAAD